MRNCHGFDAYISYSKKKYTEDVLNKTILIIISKIIVFQKEHATLQYLIIDEKSSTCLSNLSSTDVLLKDDRNALLYIVVTLLFYSMGIVIGIITYLKREQAEMEEDKMFEVYLHMKREPFNLHKQER